MKRRRSCLLIDGLDASGETTAIESEIGVFPGQDGPPGNTSPSVSDIERYSRRQ